MSMDKKRLNLDVSWDEWEILEAYRKRVKRSKSDVLREFIRSLEDKLGAEKRLETSRRKERGETEA